MCVPTSRHRPTSAKGRDDSSFAEAAGSYYTLERVVSSLVRWAVRDESDRLLDPSCGGGRFIASHRNSVGIEQDIEAAAVARERARGGRVREAEFFAWAARTHERFECAAGNPPFIRYQTFKGDVRKRALELCARLGAKLSGLAASWAPFLVATASLLKPGGRMAFVVPASIGHAPYAAPLVDYLVEYFDDVRMTAIRSKLFPELSEDCWLLHADGFGGSTTELCFSVLDRFKPSATPCETTTIPVPEWRGSWSRRLRPYLLPANVREVYRAVASDADSLRFGDVASIGIGYVSGANDFFHLRPSEAAAWEHSGSVSPSDRAKQPRTADRRSDRSDRRRVAALRRAHDAPADREGRRVAELPSSVSRYLDTDRGKQVRGGCKCRMRTPWYSVRDVQVSDFFLAYMSGRAPALVRNSAAATCTNAVHSVRVRDGKAVRRIIEGWETPFVRLSCELEGDPLGGGMLKLEPREATRIVFPASAMGSELSAAETMDAVSTMRRWRHCAIQ